MARLDDVFGKEVIQRPARPFQYDKRKEGWELIKDTVEKEQFFSASQLEPISLLKENENFITGEEMIKRAKEENASLGQRQAEYLFNHQEEIPEKWRQYHLVFPGTIWRDGDYAFCYLRWNVKRWNLFFCFLNNVFYTITVLRPCG